jgi:hypothetical protein
MSEQGYFDGEKLIDKKGQLRRARLVAMMLSVATFISIISWVFAFIQKAQADEAREQLEQLKVELVGQSRVADENAKLARANAMEADQQRSHAIELEAKLLECKTSK